MAGRSIKIIGTKYERHDKIGEGTYGIVYKGRDLEDGSLIALKKVKLDNDDEGVPSTAIREISILKEMDHPYVVGLRALIHDGPQLYLIFDFLESDLKRYIRKLQTLPKETVRKYSFQLCEGIRYCHSRRIIHRDLKPENILVSSSGDIKIADLGLARTFTLPMRAYTHEIVTLWYRPPEVLLGQRGYNTAVDMWSVGCIIVEMMTGKPLFGGDSEIDEIFKIFQILGTPTEEMWPDIKNLPQYKPNFPKWNGRGLYREVEDLEMDAHDLIMRMLRYHAAKRISAKRALEHDYFTPYFASLDMMRSPSSSTSQTSSLFG
ncbi:CMGC/CDK/CDC2 protein kinase [Atractiella rhizophila]|nr:CMGC/CDK/CDC2 protein kinase [Atractiella rhizophila]